MYYHYYFTPSPIRFIIAHEIHGEPLDPSRSPRFMRMAQVYSHMFAQTPPIFKDMWGSRFFEAWALTLLILLQVLLMDDRINTHPCLGDYEKAIFGRRRMRWNMHQAEGIKILMLLSISRSQLIHLFLLA